MPLEVVYEMPFTSIATTGEVNVGTIEAASGTFYTMKRCQITITGTPSSTDPPVTYRIRAGTADGTGTAVTGQKTDRNNGNSITSVGQKGTFSVAPTAASGSPQYGASLASTQPFYTESPIAVKATECLIFSIERNGAGATASGVVYVTIVEFP